MVLFVTSSTLLGTWSVNKDMAKYNKKRRLLHAAVVYFIQNS